ncbi:class F sortase, partial [Nitrolancea hollandica]|uniref:class F sortase n=1 Tax=Nitrolancea hollandica TaxID=1206749 RepID=UPI001930AC53
MTGREERAMANNGKTLPTALLLGLGMSVLFVAAVKDRSSRILLGLGIIFLCAAAIVAFQTPGVRRATDGETLQGPALVASTAPLPAANPVAADPTPITRIVIPAIQVDAPVTVKGLDSKGVMEAPDDPVHVAWYRFSSRPGAGGNAVFAGHVDYASVGPAVFWNLENLNSGNLIEIRLEDGTDYR